MGLTVYIYRRAPADRPGDLLKLDAEDCTNGGVSSRVAALTLVNVSGPSSPSEDAPAAYLVKGNVAGSVKIVPADATGAKDSRWLMMGGNYAGTSDSRFGEAVESLGGGRYTAIAPVHDRFEG
ncbi:hypothetical protein KIKIMORA_04750 [Brevundimonas phage vB_BpoS-Kikimora]|uniref:Uncharacterized protein n=2 Tax=Kikimoravirus TaxID=3425051 RepID=A0A9E7N4R3_9CAUD|nr:hypothetical protein KIKIMORA_04750 [Brevundimonas phage vB_BpoS-Kikimora]UTC28482.1 hypothetical protein GURKE_04800 [Brevundimonas phage vB_BpoS-Gurke]